MMFPFAVDLIRWLVGNLWYYLALAYVVPHITALPTTWVYPWVILLFAYQWERGASTSEMAVVIAATFVGLMLFYPTI